MNDDHIVKMLIGKLRKLGNGMPQREGVLQAVNLACHGQQHARGAHLRELLRHVENQLWAAFTTPCVTGPALSQSRALLQVHLLASKCERQDALRAAGLPRSVPPTGQRLSSREERLELVAV